MKLDYNPNAPLNLGWANQILSRWYVCQTMTDEEKNLFAEFKQYWQLQLDRNQSQRARHVHYSLCEKYARMLFDKFLGRDTISV